MSMFESKWAELIEQHENILAQLSIYDTSCENGILIDITEPVNICRYYDYIVAHISYLLISDQALYIPQKIFDKMNLEKSDIFSWFDWDASNGKYSIKGVRHIAENQLKEALLSYCFDEDGCNFIQEVCAHDLIHSKKLAKEIDGIFGSIAIAIQIGVLGEEAFFSKLHQNDFKDTITPIKRRYSKELNNRGALIYNRIFRHSSKNSHYQPVNLVVDSDEILNYRHDKNFCQSAVMHIAVEKTSSSGTGFVISENGYALTCAHVVEGTNEVYANVIANDGYPRERFEGFEVYDVGYGEVLYMNNDLDIALLRTEYCGSGFLALDDRPLLPELGEEVIVYGYPLGHELPQTNRFGPNISVYKGCVASNQVSNGNSITFLDIDVKSGNSGSPVISMKTGKVIGIISGAKVSGNIGLREKMPYMIPIRHFFETINYKK